MSDWRVPAALVVKWWRGDDPDAFAAAWQGSVWMFQRLMHDAQADPAIKPVRVIYATPATEEELAALKAERKEKERKHVARVVKVNVWKSRSRF